MTIPKRRAQRAVNVHEAKTSLSKLIERVGRGEEVVIARAGRPVARLVAFRATRARRRLGALDGTCRIPDDFNRPLSKSWLEAFEGE